MALPRLSVSECWACQVVGQLKLFNGVDAIGRVEVRPRGSHVRLKHPERTIRLATISGFRTQGRTSVSERTT